MAPRVTVADQLFELMYFKTVRTSDERFKDVPLGVLPEPTDHVLARQGEPAFFVSLNDPVHTDEDVPDEVGHALRRAAQRFSELGGDGAVSTDGMTIVEWVVGPALQDGGLVMYLDTDGSGAGPALIKSMTSILVNELERAGVQATISVPSTPMAVLTPWASTDERDSPR